MAVENFDVKIGVGFICVLIRSAFLIVLHSERPKIRTIASTIYVSTGGKLSVSNCTFGNNGNSVSGAILDDLSTLILTNCDRALFFTLIIWAVS